MQTIGCLPEKENNYKNCKNETTNEKKQNRHEDTRRRNEHNSYENGHRLKNLLFFSVDLITEFKPRLISFLFLPH
jgi:hypothetical protein